MNFSNLRCYCLKTSIIRQFSNKIHLIKLVLILLGYIYSTPISIPIIRVTYKVVPCLNSIVISIHDNLVSLLSHGNSKRIGRSVFFFKNTVTFLFFIFTVAPFFIKFLYIVDTLQFSNPDNLLVSIRYRLCSSSEIVRSKSTFQQLMKMGCLIGKKQLVKLFSAQPTSVWHIFERSLLYSY